MTQPDTDRDPEPQLGPDGYALQDDARARSIRALRDRARCVPLAGAFLLLSPLLNAVSGAGTIAGVPVNLLYVFGVWFTLIFITFRLASGLEHDDGEH